MLNTLHILDGAQADALGAQGLADVYAEAVGVRFSPALAGLVKRWATPPQWNLGRMPGVGLFKAFLLAGASSAPGPDGLPYAAWAATLEASALGRKIGTSSEKLLPYW